MIDVLLRPEAEADIDEIADFTIERWGRQQARTYVAALRADIARLTEFAERSPVHERSDFGLRRMRSGHHLVFYLVANNCVEVVRILHEKKDPDRGFL
ncbi:MAG: type II toxin-antitoxin system RelE/ParE family toxin [Novosphingobium sp.]|nr:type II toxin-antitoxin system RelE/ParE family toxin [Novosphingobium sp.]